MKILTIVMNALMVLSIISVEAFADDPSSETPNLENLKPPSLVNKPSRLSNKPLKVDIWAETPPLSSNASDTDTVDFHSRGVVVKSGLADPVLYLETPDLKKVTPAKLNRRPPDHVIFAEQNKHDFHKPLEYESQ